MIGLVISQFSQSHVKKCTPEGYGMTCSRLDRLSVFNKQIEAALQRLYGEKRDTNNIELKNTFHQPLAVKRERPGFCWVLAPSANVR